MKLEMEIVMQNLIMKDVIGMVVIVVNHNVKYIKHFGNIINILIQIINKDIFPDSSSTFATYDIFDCTNTDSNLDGDGCKGSVNTNNVCSRKRDIDICKEGNARCFGLCGRGCECSAYVCGDCYCHYGCMLHDHYCSCTEKGITHGNCLASDWFKCDNGKVKRSGQSQQR